MINSKNKSLLSIPQNKDTPQTIKNPAIRAQSKKHYLDEYYSKLSLYKIGFIILFVALVVGLIRLFTIKSADFSNQIITTIIITVPLILFSKMLPKYFSCCWTIKQFENNNFVIKRVTVLGTKQKSKLYSLSTYSNSQRYFLITDDGAFSLKKELPIRKVYSWTIILFNNYFNKRYAKEYCRMLSYFRRISDFNFRMILFKRTTKSSFFVL